MNKKDEAVKRLVILKVAPEVITNFRKGEIMMSKNDEKDGICFPSDSLKKEIKEFENQTDNLVYHVIYTKTMFGVMLTFLYVSKYVDEWACDIEDLKLGYSLAYVFNTNTPEFSEYGSIQFQKNQKGLLRVA